MSDLLLHAAALPPSRPHPGFRATALLAVPLLLLLLGACSKGGGGGGSGNVVPDKSDWDSLVWDEDAWR